MANWFPVAKDVILLALALWGAVLSTFNWWTARSKDARKVLVRASTLVPTMSDGSLGATYAKIEAINVGHRPVTIDYLAFELPDRRTLGTMHRHVLPEVPDTALPAKLSDGESASLLVPYAAIGHSLREVGIAECRLRPMAVDTTGRKHFGEAWAVNAAEFLAM